MTEKTNAGKFIERQMKAGIHKMNLMMRARNLKNY